MNLIKRKFSGDNWPEKRISLSDADSGYCLFVSARYAELVDSERYADLIIAEFNATSDLREKNKELRLEIQKLRDAYQVFEQTGFADVLHDAFLCYADAAAHTIAEDDSVTEDDSYAAWRLINK